MRTKFKQDENWVLKNKTNRKFTLQCDIINENFSSLSFAGLKFKAYTWDEVTYIGNKKEIKYLIFFAKNDKKVSFNLYKSAMERDERLYNQLLYAEEIIEDKKNRKIKQDTEKENLIKSINIGDIFVASWGYEQTNVNAYQVIEKKSKTLILSEITFNIASLCSEGYMSCDVIPAKDSFINKNNTIKKLVSSNGIKISSSQFAFKWDGVSSYHNSWYA